MNQCKPPQRSEAWVKIQRIEHKQTFCSFCEPNWMQGNLSWICLSDLLTRAQQCLSPQGLGKLFLSLKSSSPSLPFQVTVPISDRLWLFSWVFSWGFDLACHSRWVNKNRRWKEAALFSGFLYFPPVSAWLCHISAAFMVSLCSRNNLQMKESRGTTRTPQESSLPPSQLQHTPTQILFQGLATSLI